MIGEIEDKKDNEDSEVLTYEDEDNLEESSKRKYMKSNFIRNKRRRLTSTVMHNDSIRKRKHQETPPCSQDTPSKKLRTINK